MKNKQTPLQRINTIIDFNWKRGVNKESVNQVYRNIVKNNVLRLCDVAEKTHTNI